MPVLITHATLNEFDAIWKIFNEVVKTGDTFAFDPETSPEMAKKHWFAENVDTYVAREGDKIVGTYILRENRYGLGSHVGNAAYMVAKSARGKGVGKAMALHSIESARAKDFLAMQFNFVVSTNKVAVNLWKSVGFEIIGTIPKGYRHKELGLVDAYIMHRFL